MTITLELQDIDPADIVISTLDVLEGFGEFLEKTSLSPTGHHETHIMIVATDKRL